MHPGGDARRRRRTRVIGIVVASVLVLALGLAGLGLLGARYVSGLAGQAVGGFDDGTGGMPEGPVEVPVERLDLVSSVAATGSLAAGRPLTVAFDGTADVVEVVVAVGDRVSAGQVLARQDPRLAQVELDAAEAALAAAERAAGAPGPSAGDELAAADALVAEARVAVRSAADALEGTEDVAAANAAGLQSAVDAAARQVERDEATAATTDAALAAAKADRTSPQQVRRAGAELSAARTAATAARDALVAAAERVADATASGDEAAIATATAREGAAGTALAAAEARVADAQVVVDAAAATVEAAGLAADEAAAAHAGVAASEEAVVAAADARRIGLALDAQTVDSSRSALAQSEAALEVLLTGGAAGGPAGLPDAGTSPQELQVAVDRARLDVEAAEAVLAGRTLTAPVDGTVTAVDATVGRPPTGGVEGLGRGAGTTSAGLDDAAADDGAPGDGAPGDGAPDDMGAGDIGAGGSGETGSGAGSITITATQALVAEIRVPETDAVLLSEGMPAELKFSALPDVVGTGRVLTVVATDPAAEEVTFDPFSGQPSPQGTYTVTISVDDLPDGARGGLSIAARVTVGTAPSALVVPSAALAQLDGRTVVRRVAEGGADEMTEEVPVEVGLRQGGWTEVLTGLDEGDVVVVGGTAGDPGFEDPGLQGNGAVVDGP